jgi:hypothetical protein
MFPRGKWDLLKRKIRPRYNKLTPPPKKTVLLKKLG